MGLPAHSCSVTSITTAPIDRAGDMTAADLSVSLETRRITQKQPSQTRVQIERTERNTFIYFFCDNNADFVHCFRTRLFLLLLSSRKEQLSVTLRKEGKTLTDAPHPTIISSFIRIVYLFLFIYFKYKWKTSIYSQSSVRPHGSSLRVCVGSDVLLWRREVTQTQSDRPPLVRHDALRCTQAQLLRVGIW